MKLRVIALRCAQSLRLRMNPSQSAPVCSSTTAAASNDSAPTTPAVHTYRIDADFPAFFGGRKYSAQSEPDQVRQFYQEAARTVTKLRLPGQH